MNATTHKAQAAPTVIVGLGETGLSCARYFGHAGEPFEVVDNRSQPPGLEALRRDWPEVRVTLGRFDARRLQAARRIVVSPGLSLRDPAIAAAVEAGVECVGDIELFARAVGAPVIAITGSNGKSTVALMTAALLEHAGCRVRAGGNLGPPALDLLADTETDPDFYVLELSSFQLETTHSLRPAAAVVLNVSADHQDRYATLAEYAAAKGRIYDGTAVAVVNRDDPGAARLASRVRRVLGFTLGVPDGDDFGVAEDEAGTWLVHGERRLLRAERVSLPGRHNRANALAALALVHAVGIDPAAAAPALESFKGLPHRMQRIAEAGGVTWYDDSKATNVGAAAAALEGMEAPVILIAGGDGKGADFSALRDPVARHVRRAILIGRDARRIAETLGDAVAVEFAESIDDAVERAAAAARAGDCVLLSPACASFDMFPDYRARGEAFAAAVRRRCA